MIYLRMFLLSCWPSFVNVGVEEVAAAVASLSKFLCPLRHSDFVVALASYEFRVCSSIGNLVLVDGSLESDKDDMSKSEYRPLLGIRGGFHKGEAGRASGLEFAKLEVGTNVGCWWTTGHAADRTKRLLHAPTRRCY